MNGIAVQLSPTETASLFSYFLNHLIVLVGGIDPPCNYE